MCHFTRVFPLKRKHTQIIAIFKLKILFIYIFIFYFSDWTSRVLMSSHPCKKYECMHWGSSRGHSWHMMSWAARLQSLWRGSNDSEGPEHLDSDQGTTGSPESAQEKAISVNRSQFPPNLSNSFFFFFFSFSWMPQATVSIQHGNLSSVPKKRERALDSQSESTLHQEECRTLCGAYYNLVLYSLYHKYLYTFLKPFRE